MIGNIKSRHRINWEICTPYEGAAGRLLHRNGNLTIRITSHTLFMKQNRTNSFICILVWNREYLSKVKTIQTSLYFCEMKESYCTSIHIF